MEESWYVSRFKEDKSIRSRNTSSSTLPYAALRCPCPVSRINLSILLISNLAAAVSPRLKNTLSAIRILPLFAGLQITRFLPCPRPRLPCSPLSLPCDVVHRDFSLSAHSTSRMSDPDHSNSQQTLTKDSQPTINHPNFFLSLELQTIFPTCPRLRDRDRSTNPDYSGKTQASPQSPPSRSLKRLRRPIATPAPAWPAF